MNRTFPRPTRRRYDALALDAPLPLLVTCAGMALPWPSGGADAPLCKQEGATVLTLCAGCGGYADACQCSAPGTPPADWDPETEQLDADLFASDAYDACPSLRVDARPTLAQRLADSMLDDRAA